jgi:hypothetical protein
MAIRIVAYESSHIPAVRAFNERVKPAGAAVFPETNVPAWLPPSLGSGLFQEFFLAHDDDGVVRGGYFLKHQAFVLNGEILSIGNYQLPISEAIVDKRYGAVPLQLLLDALRRQPLLFSLGIGGYGEPLTRLLQSLRFRIVTVPFYFRVEHAAPFLRETRPLRRSRLSRFVCDVAAVTGLGALGISLAQRLRTVRGGPPRPAEVKSFGTFDSSADRVWDATRSTFALGAVRDHLVAARLYDRPGNRFIKVGVHAGGRMRGWVVSLATAFRDHKYFGDLKIGSIVDCLVEPGYEVALIDAAVDRLRHEDVDLIVTNQSFASVVDALSARGFLRGPSNFLFAASEQLADRLDPLENMVGRFHLNRGDGDGPIHL